MKRVLFSTKGPVIIYRIFLKGEGWGGGGSHGFQGNGGGIIRCQQSIKEGTYKTDCRLTVIPGGGIVRILLRHIGG